MIAVIIAGGSGTRLWPLSRSDFPKHLLKLTNDKSLLQNTTARASKLTKQIYVVTEKSHADVVRQQLPSVPADHVIIEPARRGTASCIILALARIKADGVNGEPIIFMHADHHIRDDRAFVEAVEQAARVASAEQRIVLLGIEPTNPSTAFGYIEREDGHNGFPRVYRVKSFKEKPDHKTAQRYLNSGNYLWNMGYFVAPLGVFEVALQNYAADLWANYQQLLNKPKSQNKTYLSFANEAIDTALIEKVKDLRVVPGLFDWMDVGSFSDLHSVSAFNEAGNTLQGRVETEGLTNSFVRNDTKVPVAVIGLDNVAVVVTKHGVLVTNKTHSQKVGDVAKRIAKS